MIDFDLIPRHWQLSAAKVLASVPIRFTLWRRR